MKYFEKRYTLTDHEKNKEFRYSTFEWDWSWRFAYITGIAFGIFLGYFIFG